MGKIENFWQNLFRKNRKKKKDTVGDRCDGREEGEEGEDKENIGQHAQQTRPKPSGSSTFPRPGRESDRRDEETTADVGHHRSAGEDKVVDGGGGIEAGGGRGRRQVEANGLGVSTTSLRARRQDPYDRHMWSSNQHFHIPQGAQRYHWKTSSRVALSAGPSMELCRSLQRSHSPSSYNQGQETNTMRKPIEPSVSMQHFHIPANRRRRLVYGRADAPRTAMHALVDDMRTRTRNRSPSSINNQEPIQLAHFPGGLPRGWADHDTSNQAGDTSGQLEDRKRRIDDQGDADADVEDEDEESEGEEEEEETRSIKLKRREEELAKISTGIGKVFLETIRQTERIKSAKLYNVDPRSAARTPGANREPRYKLRYKSPAWASPSRDTLHARPWTSEDDLERPVILSSSGCASGCASDLYPPVNGAPTPTRTTTPTLPRNCKPGYTQYKASTMPHIRSVSGRVLDAELGLGPEATSTPTPDAAAHSLGYSTLPATGGSGISTRGTPYQHVSNTHSGVLYTTNNNFSWLSLAKFQNEETLRKNPSSRFFARPELRHQGTLLDQ